MMPDLGKYALHVLVSYGVTLGLLLALVVVSWLQGRRVKRRLDAAERGGNV